MKYVVVVLDGAADDRIASLGQRTQIRLTVHARGQNRVQNRTFHRTSAAAVCDIPEVLLGVYAVCNGITRREDALLGDNERRHRAELVHADRVFDDRGAGTDRVRRRGLRNPLLKRTPSSRHCRFPRKGRYDLFCPEFG